MAKLQIDKTKLFESLGYEPHAAQRVVHESEAQIRVLCTGARFGKTTLAAYETVAALLAPSEHTLGWIAAPCYSLTEHVFNETLSVFEELMPHRIRSYVPRTRTLTVVNITGGSSVLVAKSCDNPSGLLGSALDFLVVDEAAQLDRRVWEEVLQARLIDRRGRALLISTPKGISWFYKMWKRGQRGVEGHASWRFPTTANPHIDAALVEAQRPLMSEDAFAEQFLAEFRGERKEPCDTCGGPSRMVSGTHIVKDGRELPRCAECGMLTNAQGVTIVSTNLDGSPRCKLILFPDDGEPGVFVNLFAPKASPVTASPQP